MHWRTGYAIVCYQLAVGITFYMVLISEMSFAVLLCPVCVYVFLSEFTFVFGLFLFLGNHTVFDFFVLVPAVSLPRCVNYRTFVADQSFFFKVLVKHTEQCVYCFCFCKVILEFPDRLRIGDLIAKVYSQKSHKAHSVIDLIFCLIVWQVIQPLQYQYLEHHYHVIRRASSLSCVLLTTTLVQYAAELFPLDYSVQYF